MSLLSQATVGTVGLLCKTFLKIGCSSVTVNGLENLYGALESDERNQGRGVVTGALLPSLLLDPPLRLQPSLKPYINVRILPCAMAARLSLSIQNG